MVPCMDEICGENHDTELTISVDADDHENESGHADHCSPFCTCSCCHSNCLFVGGERTAILEFPVRKMVQPEREPHSSFLDRIWHPPKA